MRWVGLFVLASLLLIPGAPGGTEPEAGAEPAVVRRAVERSLPLLQAGARTFRERSEGRCIGCHHQGPLQHTVVLARERGFPIDEASEREELKRIQGFYAAPAGTVPPRRDRPRGPARADSYGNFTVHAGYWLTGYAAARGRPDDATAAAAALFASKQEADGHWDFEDTARAPLQAGEFTITALAVRVLQEYGTGQAERIERARQWMLRTPARTTDEQVYRLYGLVWVGLDPAEVQKGATRLAAEQRADGGWAQQDNMPSDAYATGLVLVALHRAGGLGAETAAYRRGAAYLLRTQQADGSWFVRSRAIPSNPYFESGFPHGRSQFISYAATCHATAALLLTVERPR